MALQSTMRNMVAVLVGAGVVAALGLGLVNALTKKPIEQAKAEKVLSALREVLPEFDNDAGVTGGWGSVASLSRDAGRQEGGNRGADIFAARFWGRDILNGWF